MNILILFKHEQEALEASSLGSNSPLYLLLNGYIYSRYIASTNFDSFEIILKNKIISDREIRIT